MDEKTIPVVPAEIGEFDAYLGWKLKPNAIEKSSRTGYSIEYRINSKGLRDDETTYDKPDSIYRIVLLGDSRTFGYGVPIEKHFSQTLEGFFRNVEIINMGVSGYGLDQLLIYLRSEGFKYDPDMVILYVAHYGDHRHMHTQRFGKQKPRFKLVDGELILTNSPIKKPEQSILKKINGWFRDRSVAYDIFYNGIKTLLSGTQLDAEVQQDLDKKNFENESFRKELYELGEALVLQIAKETRDYGATFVLVNQIDSLHSACIRNNIYALKVFKPMSNRKFSLKDDLGHFNEAGSGVLSWEIEKFLEENNLMPLKYFENAQATY
jgi:hypothetical protein